MGELWELQLPLLGKVIARKLFVRVLTNIEENDLDRGRDGHDYFGAIGPSVHDLRSLCNQSLGKLGWRASKAGVPGTNVRLPVGCGAVKSVIRAFTLYAYALRLV